MQIGLTDREAQVLAGAIKTRIRRSKKTSETDVLKIILDKIYDAGSQDLKESM